MPGKHTSTNISALTGPFAYPLSPLYHKLSITAVQQGVNVVLCSVDVAFLS